MMPATHRVWAHVTTFALLLGSACGGGAAPSPAQSPEPSATPPPASESPKPAAASNVPAAGDDAWEGEAEATGKGNSSGPEQREARTREVIAKVVRANRQPFRDCYDGALARDANLPAGTLTLHFVLDPQGNVKLAELNEGRSTVKSPAVVSCAVAQFIKLKFPPSSRGMETNGNYPFDFKR